MKVIVEVRFGLVANVFAPAGTDVEIWDFDTYAEEDAEPLREKEMREIINAHGLVEEA